MLQEREMVLDCLNTIKHDIVDLTIAAEEAANENVRSTFLALRNRAEQAHQQLVQIATRNGYYTPAPPADHAEVQRIINSFNWAQAATAAAMTGVQTHVNPMAQNYQ